MDLSRKESKSSSVPFINTGGNDCPCSDLSEVLIWIGVEQAALSSRDLSLKDDALTGANQDGSRVGLIAKLLVPAHTLDEVASPAGQTTHLLCVPVKIKTLSCAQADEQMRTCNMEKMKEDVDDVVTKSKTYWFITVLLFHNQKKKKKNSTTYITSCLQINCVSLHVIECGNA